MLLIDWVCICLHCSNSTSCTWINHSNKHGLSASFTSDHWSGDHDGQLPSYTEDLLSFHNSWLFAVIELQKKTWFFPVRQALVTCCRRQTRQNTRSLAEIIQTFFQSIRRIRDCVHELIIIMKFVPCCGGGRGLGGANRQTNQSENNTDWITIALY